MSEDVGGALDTSQFAVARFRHVLSALLRMSCHCQFVAHCKRSYLLQHDIGKKKSTSGPFVNQYVSCENGRDDGPEMVEWC